ncbi:MAG: CatA-like O-acetyltransferase, partial [Fusobacteriaceae bacterium]
MKFNLIQMETWERKEYYNHYINNIVCTYSVTVNLNITNLVGQKIYPAMLWLLTDTVNELKEFRTSLSLDGLGIYEDMNPSYTIFNKEN